MNTYEESDEEVLSDTDIQRSIEESCLSSLQTGGAYLTLQAAGVQVPPGGGLETALTQAVAAGLVENVRVLLDRGASPLNTNSRSESPLLLAVRGGSYQVTQVLLSRGSWVGQPGPRGWTALHEAARQGGAEVLLLLLRSGAPVALTTTGGRTALAVAAEHGQAHIAEILLNCGSRVNSQALSGESVLMAAAGAGDPSLVRLLLDNGANPDLPSGTGHLAVHKAAYAGHYRVLEMLLPLTCPRSIKAAGQSPLHSAAAGGHARCLRLLLASGADVNYRMSARHSGNHRDLRRSALYYAVSNGDAGCTRALLEAGARPDLDPLQCLLVAVRSGRHDLARLLLLARADANCYFRAVSDTVFPTALQYALKDAAMMRLLLNHGYDARSCFLCHHGDNDDDQGGHAPGQSRRLRCGCGGCGGGAGARTCSRWDHEDPRPAGDHGDRAIPFCEFMGLCCLVHLSGLVVRTLLDYVGQVSLCPPLRSLLQGQGAWADICSILRSPRSLGHICRLEIRRCLTLKRLSNPDVMNSDLFPPRLRDYLLYRELDPQTV
ncbi:unnamed protein product [Boreogadus saida]